MKEIAYYDGMIGTPQEVKIPFDDRVHFFGDGVYEAALGAGGKIFLLQEHLDRLYSSAAMHPSCMKPWPQSFSFMT